MMMRNQSKRRAMLKYLLVIPLTLTVMLVFSNADAQESLQKQAEALEEAFTSVTTISSDALKLKSEDRTLSISADNITLKMDTIPWPSEQAKPISGDPTYEIIYPDGTIKTTTDSKFIGNEINPNDIEKIEVFREPKSLVKIWIKGNPNNSAAPIFAGCENIADPEERKKCSDKEMLMFIYKNIKYPAAAREKGIQGTVYVKYGIDERGYVTGATIEKGVELNK